jgi:hypothetical protein
MSSLITSPSRWSRLTGCTLMCGCRGWPTGVGSRGFFVGHCGHEYASTALMDPMTRAFVADIHGFVAAWGLELVHFAKGQRKDPSWGSAGTQGLPPALLPLTDQTNPKQGPHPRPAKQPRNFPKPRAGVATSRVPPSLNFSLHKLPTTTLRSTGEQAIACDRQRSCSIRSKMSALVSCCQGGKSSQSAT